MKTDAQKFFSSIPFEVVIFLVNDVKHNPKIISAVRDLYIRSGIEFDKKDPEMILKITEGTLLQIWLKHGGKIPKKYGYRRKTN